MRGVISVACVLLDCDEDCALILQRDPTVLCYLPGGMIERGENEEQAVERHVRTWTGLAPLHVVPLLEIEREEGVCSFWMARRDDCDGGLQISCGHAWVQRSQIGIRGYEPSVAEALDAAFAFQRGVSYVVPLAHHRSMTAAALNHMPQPPEDDDDGPSSDVLQLHAQFPSFDEALLARVLETAGAMGPAVSRLSAMREEARQQRSRPVGVG